MHLLQLCLVEVKNRKCVAVAIKNLDAASAGKTEELRTKNYEQLRVIQQLYDDGIKNLQKNKIIF